MRLVTTHDWREPVDVDHIAAIRRDAWRHAVGGVVHLVLEVLAYALDEAAEGSTREICVTLHPDGSVSVADDGRGTDTRRDSEGVWVVKPVIATRDVRFFGEPSAPSLPDGLPREGMSVVAALTAWLVHTNVRHDTAWSARYEKGVPVGLPVSVGAGGPTGTIVHLMPDPTIFDDHLDVDSLSASIATIEGPATIHLVDERA